MDIDVVITWVDGNNEEWRALRDRYAPKRDDAGVDTRARRYRDWDNLQYLLRGIERHMPWVRRVYLVTPGHYPSWANPECDKLVLVDQNDIMPEEYTPTFNNCAVELFFHRIPGISQHFVYFNDDMFPLRDLAPSDFFKDGFPCDTVGFSAIPASFSVDGKGVFGIGAYCTAMVAKHFTKAEVWSRNKRKLLDPRNGKAVVKTILLAPYKDLTGFNEGLHAPYSYLRCTYETVWAHCEEELRATCESRFRPQYGAAHWVMRYWQICEGSFSVRDSRFAAFFDLEKLGDEDAAISCIEGRRASTFCINDDVESDDDFIVMRDEVDACMRRAFPHKSSFER